MCGRSSARRRTPRAGRTTAEQMMLDEGFHAGEPKYRLAQLQDALLRDVRFIVGIKMHTQGMTVEEATKLFETQGHQPHPVARIGGQTRHRRRAVWLLHDGQADDSEAARRLQGEDGRRRTRCRNSTTRSSSSGRCRCRSSARLCSARSGQSSNESWSSARGGTPIVVSVA